MPFDPDAYLAEKEKQTADAAPAAPARAPGGGFDPDAYLASKEPPRDIGGNESFGFGALKGGTFGTAPAIAKAGGKLSSYLPDSVRQWLVKKTTGLDVPTDALHAADANPEFYRDQYRKAETAAQKANPKTFLAGDIAGSTLAPTPFGGLAKGATSVGGKVLARAAQGATTGAMFGAGEAIGEGKDAGEILKRGGEGAAGGAVLNPVFGAAGDVVGSAASKLLQRKAEKRMAEQAVKDMMGSRATVMATRTDRRLVAQQAETLKSEMVSDPDALKIADISRNDPGQAWKMVRSRVNQITQDRAPSYAAFDAETGGVRVKGLRRFLADHVDVLRKDPGNETEIGAVEKMISNIDETWGQQLAPTVPTIKMREYVTKLQDVAADTMGNLEETRRIKVLNHVSGLAKDFLNQHIDDAVKQDPALRPVADGLRDINKRTAAWLSLEDAMKTRASKMTTDNMVGGKAKAMGAISMAGMAEMAHALHSPYAAATFAAGAAAPYVLPPLDRAVTRGLAGMTPGSLDVGNTARYIQAARNARLQPPSETDYTQP